jgi:hypothetical protein
MLLLVSDALMVFATGTVIPAAAPPAPAGMPPVGAPPVAPAAPAGALVPELGQALRDAAVFGVLAELEDESEPEEHAAAVIAIIAAIATSAPVLDLVT